MTLPKTLILSHLVVSVLAQPISLSQTWHSYKNDNRDGTLILMNGAASWQATGRYMCNGSVILSTIWNRVAIVGNDNEHNYFYLNGQKVASGYFLSSTNIMHMANGLIQFGNINYGGLSRYFRCYMEEIRLSNIVRYTDNFTPQSLR